MIVHCNLYFNTPEQVWAYLAFSFYFFWDCDLFFRWERRETDEECEVSGIYEGALLVVVVVDLEDTALPIF